MIQPIFFQRCQVSWLEPNGILNQHIFSLHLQHPKSDFETYQIVKFLLGIADDNRIREFRVLSN